jgi:hypothetical protein
MLPEVVEGDLILPLPAGAGLGAVDVEVDLGQSRFLQLAGKFRGQLRSVREDCGLDAETGYERHNVEDLGISEGLAPGDGYAITVR